MERIGVRELRQHASRYLDLVKHGESVDVTERGQLVARLVPPTPAQTSLDRLIAEGRIIPATRGRELLRGPVHPHPAHPDSADVLDQLREERW